MADPWAVLAAAFGPLQWQQLPAGARMREDHLAQFEHQGTLISIRRQYAKRQHSGGGWFWTWQCVLRTQYAPRPLLMKVSPHHIGWPRLPTGDPLFDQRFRLSGAPAELLLRAFSPELRARLLAVQPSAWIFAEDGAFGVEVEDLLAGDPAQLRATTNVFVAVVQGVCAQIDRAHADVAARTGPAGAKAWTDEQWAALSALERDTSNRKAVILVAVFAFVMLSVVGTILSLLV